MGRTINIICLLILSVAFIGCEPDLVITDFEVTWNGANMKAEAEITNTGNLDAGHFMVYFNGDEYPESQNHRPQIRHNVPNLAQGDTIVLEADFVPLSHPGNSNLENIYQISVLADPKREVSESREDNNTARLPVITPSVELYDRNDNMIPENPAPLTEMKLPVLFIHGHNINSAMDQDYNYRKNWQLPLDYPIILKLPSFKIALDLPQNSGLDIEPYYIRFQDQGRSIIEDSGEIGEAINRILKRHAHPTATQLKVAVIAYSKGTISTRWYLKNMMPFYQPVSEFIAIAPPNHGLASGNSQTASSLAIRQLNNGYDTGCTSFNEIQSEDFIENLNGHPIEDTMTDSQQQIQYNGEAYGSRPNGSSQSNGILYVTLFANNNRDFVGGDTSSNDCQGRILAKNLSTDAENIDVSQINGLTAAGVHANTVHTPEVICIALYTAIHHQAPPSGFSCSMENADDRRVPVIPLP